MDLNYKKSFLGFNLVVLLAMTSEPLSQTAILKSHEMKNVTHPTESSGPSWGQSVVHTDVGSPFQSLVERLIGPWLCRLDGRDPGNHRQKGDPSSSAGHILMPLGWHRVNASVPSRATNDYPRLSFWVTCCIICNGLCSCARYPSQPSRRGQLLQASMIRPARPSQTLRLIAAPARISHLFGELFSFFFQEFHVHGRDQK